MKKNKVEWKRVKDTKIGDFILIQVENNKLSTSFDVDYFGTYEKLKLRLSKETALKMASDILKVYKEK